MVEHVSLDRITSATSPVDEPEKQKYAAHPAYLASMNLEVEAWLVDSVLKHHRKQNNTLEFLVQ